MQFEFLDESLELDINQKPIHSGKFSQIFLLTAERKIICKIVHRNLHNFEKQRFINQASLWNKMYPDFPCRLMERNGQTIFIREFIEGVTLSHVGDKKQIEARLVDALREINRLHEHQHLCTDVKPANFLVRHENSVMLIDLGSAIPFGFQQPENYTIPFTFIYAPSEMILNRYDLCNPSSDYYMWAMMAFHLLTNKKPFNNPNPVLLMNQQINTFPPYELIKDKTWRNRIKELTFKKTFPKPPHRMSRTDVEKILLESIAIRTERAEKVLKEILAIANQ